jgi:hypothetical protein
VNFMPDPDKDDVARALERLTSNPSSAPTPQPKPRVAPTPKVRVNPAASQPAVQKPAQKVARPGSPGPNSKARPAKPDSIEQSIAAAASAARKSAPRAKAKQVIPGLALRRTLIPVLLTGGALLIILATIRYAWNSIDNPMTELPRTIATAMICVGLICWLLAAANMFLVRRALIKADVNRG